MSVATPDPPSTDAGRFDRDTAVERIGPHRFRSRMDRGWWIVDGPNGGYVAAQLVRALALEVDDPARRPRSLGIHYTARPREGEAEIATATERRGRSLSTVTARLEQDGRLCALATAAFSAPRDALSWDHSRMPEVPAPEELTVRDPMLPMHARLEMRFAPGAGPDDGASRPFVAGWIRLREPRAVDPPLLATLCDAMPPPAMVWREGGRALGPLPTVDLTVHFRSDTPRSECGPDAFCLAVFRSQIGRDGFVEEDGEIWSRDGLLLAQSRQLAVMTGGPPPGG